MTRLTNLRSGFRDTVLVQVLFTAFFLANAVLGYFLLRAVAEEHEQVTTARNNIALIDALLIDILQAETGQRGYLLTTMDSYAAPYFDSLASIQQNILELSTAPLDAEQQNRYYELRMMVEQRLTELKRNLDLLRDIDARSAALEIMSHLGVEQMLAINVLIAEMKSHEVGLLEVHQMAAEQRRQGAFLLLLAANGVGMLLVFLSLRLARTGIRKELRYLEEQEAATQNLEIQVEERTLALQHFSNELKRSNRELQDFAFVASHDLQEPLRKIRAFGDRLQQSYSEQLGAQGSDYVQRMQGASERMSRLINDLLSFSRITTKPRPFLPISLNKVAEEVVEDLEVAIEEAGATITFDDLPEIEADFVQMKQMFQNLLANAIKFRKPGVPPVIAVLLDRDEDEGTHSLQRPLTLRFTDNGIGFDDMYLDRIFLPFQRLHSKSEYAGTGIGLAVCRRIAERHGGSLTATSTPGVGSTFVVTLARVNHIFDLREPT